MLIAGDRVVLHAKMAADVFKMLTVRVVHVIVYPTALMSVTGLNMIRSSDQVCCSGTKTSVMLLPETTFNVIIPVNKREGTGASAASCNRSLCVHQFPPKF